jgi:hypothetical protein
LDADAAMTDPHRPRPAPQIVAEEMFARYRGRSDFGDALDHLRNTIAGDAAYAEAILEAFVERLADAPAPEPAESGRHDPLGVAADATEPENAPALLRSAAVDRAGPGDV